MRQGGTFSIMINAFTYFLQGWWRSDTGRDSVEHLEAAAEKGGVFSIVQKRCSKLTTLL